MCFKYVLEGCRSQDVERLILRATLCNRLAKNAATASAKAPPLPPKERGRVEELLLGRGSVTGGFWQQLTDQPEFAFPFPVEENSHA